MSRPLARLFARTGERVIVDRTGHQAESRHPRRGPFGSPGAYIGPGVPATILRGLR